MERIASYGIFIKTILTQLTNIIQSSSYNVLPYLAEENIKNLMSRILGIINIQLREIRKNKIYQEFKRARIGSRDRTLSREVTVAVESLGELKITFDVETEADDYVCR